MTLENVDLSDLLVKSLLPRHVNAQRRYERIDDWAGDSRPGSAKPKLPQHATREYRQLADLSATPWGDLIVDSLTQMLYVEGYRKADGTQLPGWTAWQKNGMDARQIPLHFDAIKYGLAYATVLPSEPDTYGSGTAVIRPKSPKRMTAFYDDPVDDEWPQFSLELRPIPRGGQGGFRVVLLDETFAWSFDIDSEGRMVTGVTRSTHGVGVCPVVRFANKMDLVGQATGEVEPYITLFHRIDQTVFDRLVVQRFAAFVVRTISGMAPPDGVPTENVTLTTEQQALLEAAKVRLSADGALISDDPNTTFGSLPPSPLDPFVTAKDSDVRDLSAVAQVPRHALLGIEANMGSEALASAEKGQSRKKVQRQHTLGESYEQALALAERIEGAANDPMAQVVWFDTEPAALPSTADALVKLRDVGVPLRAVFQRVPGATQTDVDAWVAEVLAAGQAPGQATQAEAVLARLAQALGVAAV